MMQIVSVDGKIGIPIIGILSVAKLTLKEAEALFQKEVTKYYRNVKSGLILESIRAPEGGDH